MRKADKGKGPFRSARFDFADTPGSVVFDCQRDVFCVIPAGTCAGSSEDAAMARATRIAESLNKTEGHTK